MMDSAIEHKRQRQTDGTDNKEVIPASFGPFGSGRFSEIAHLYRQKSFIRPQVVVNLPSVCTAIEPFMAFSIFCSSTG